MNKHEFTCVTWPVLQKLGGVRVVGATCAACSLNCLDNYTFPVCTACFYKKFKHVLFSIDIITLL